MKLKRIDGLRRKFNEVFTELDCHGNACPLKDPVSSLGKRCLIGEVDDNISVVRKVYVGPFPYPFSLSTTDKVTRRRLFGRLDPPEEEILFNPLPSRICADHTVEPIERESVAEEPKSVKIEVMWPSKTLERNLQTDFQPLGKMLIRGTYKQIARIAWRNVKIQKELNALV